VCPIVNALAGRLLGAYDLGVATPRALVHADDKNSGDARSVLEVDDLHDSFSLMHFRFLYFHKLEQISSAFLRDESSAMIQNKVLPKLGDPGSFLIPCAFSKAFSCNALGDLGDSTNLMPYSLYVKLSLEALKPIKMRVRLAGRSFQHPIGIAENMLVEVGKFAFPVDFIILEMEEDSKVPLILGRPFLHTTNAVILIFPVGIKSLLNAASITAALIDVNAAQSKLVLLENFNENYSKCLRLLMKLQLLVESYYC
ncbi:reverse transcriptase domain-containing protein, partial [Tanacetum coccineum]